MHSDLIKYRQARHIFNRICLLRPLYISFVFYKLWSWIVVPTFSVQAISFLASFGLLIMFYLLIEPGVRKRSEWFKRHLEYKVASTQEQAALEKIQSTGNLHVLITISIIFLLGYMLKHFMI